MDEKIIELKEKFKIDDSHSKIRGVVCAYDDSGNLLFEKENMIVEGGRRYIMKHGIDENTFKYAVIGTDALPTIPNDTLDGKFPEGSLLKADVVVNNGNNNDISTFFNNKNYVNPDNSNTNKFFYKIDYDNLNIEFIIVFDDDKYIRASSLGLVVEDEATSILFSRVTFPTYYKSNTQRITFKYYIYF